MKKQDDEIDWEKQKRLDEATEHPYECKCELCLEWWKEMGPER